MDTKWAAFLAAYDMGQRLGRGTFGEVRVCRRVSDGALCAMKTQKARDEEPAEDMWDFMQRELCCLLRLSRQPHPNVVQLWDSFSRREALRVAIVMSHADMDLRGFMQRRYGVVPPLLAARFTKEMFQGVAHVHDALHILHRDLKPGNMLLKTMDDASLRLQIADFGLARQWTNGQMTGRVATSWYRAPEIALGEDDSNMSAYHYSFASDIWSLGCTVAELLIGSPIFMSKTSGDYGVLIEVFKCLGTPDPSVWPDCTRLPGWRANFPKMPPQRLGDIIRARAGQAQALEMPEVLVDIVARTLVYNPALRPTAVGALSILRHLKMAAEAEGRDSSTHSAGSEAPLLAAALSFPTGASQALALPGVEAAGHQRPADAGALDKVAPAPRRRLRRRLWGPQAGRLGERESAGRVIESSRRESRTGEEGRSLFAPTFINIHHARHMPTLARSRRALRLLAPALVSAEHLCPLRQQPARQADQAMQTAAASLTVNQLSLPPAIAVAIVTRATDTDATRSAVLSRASRCCSATSASARSQVATDRSACRCFA